MIKHFKNVKLLCSLNYEYIETFHENVNKSKKEGKDQELIQSSTTPDPGYQWESDKVTIRCQEINPFPAGDHKASTNRRA